MTDTSEQEAVELLQQLGLKEYESRAFVVLSRLPRGTAKDISDRSEVPRTRVYDAVRVLESKGLVEIQHGSPQQFRAVPVAEAVETLRKEYDQRVESLRSRLSTLDSLDEDGNADATHEVWSLSGAEAIRTRTTELVHEATEEVLLVVGTASAFTDDLADALRLAGERGVSVTVGTLEESLRQAVAETLPDASVYVSGLSLFGPTDPDDDDTRITRLLLVDRTTILLSATPGDGGAPSAIFGRGFTNGLVTLVRRLVSTELATH